MTNGGHRVNVGDDACSGIWSFAGARHTSSWMTHTGIPEHSKSDGGLSVLEAIEGKRQCLPVALNF